MSATRRVPKASAEKPRHLLDLINTVQPKAALFTTYTFSVSYFDSVFVPVLRAAGCQDISVLLDADEAARCVEDHHSRAAGRVYSIVTVIAPGGGIFHPKIAVLYAESADVLAVCSGNLTASGQSIQLESFDSVSAQDVPTVFNELADWMQELAAQTDGVSRQAARLLAQSAPRARQAYRRSIAQVRNAKLAPPSLVHTLHTTAQDQLERKFHNEVETATEITILSPFHSPDGGPFLRLAAALNAKNVQIGLDAQRMLIPFDQKKFKPKIAGQFVVPNVQGLNRRLHAKVFVLQAVDKALVMTGSINATVQSFESTLNVEVSLARWLSKSPFAWTEVQPTGYQPSQEPSELRQRALLTVESWLSTDRILHGLLFARGSMPASVKIRIIVGEAAILEADVSVGTNGAFAFGPLPAFDTSKGTILTVSADSVSATCWLNVHDELYTSADARDRRAALARVLGGGYDPEDIAQLIHLLSLVASGVAVTQSTSPAPPASDKDAFEADVGFSFMRWENSGRHRGGTTSLGRDPRDLLRAMNQFLNAAMSAPIAEGDLILAPSTGAHTGLSRLNRDNGDTDGVGLRPDPLALMDQLCQLIRSGLERQPGLPHAAVLAEVAASRAMDRAIRHGWRMTPCFAWLDSFSRFVYPKESQEEICCVAAAMACFTSYRLEQAGEDPQFAVLRDFVDRFSGEQLQESRWVSLATAGLERQLYRRASADERAAAISMCRRLASAATLDDSLLVLLQKALNENGRGLGCEVQLFPEVAAELRARQVRKADLLKGVLDASKLSHGGCPFCSLKLEAQEVTTLRQKHVLFHKPCKKLCFYTEHSARLRQGLAEIQSA